MQILESARRKKAPVLDKIACTLFKRFSSIVGSSLAYIFKSCIYAGIFPGEWKIAKVTPMFEKGSDSDLGNYRPLLYTVPRLSLSK